MRKVTSAEATDVASNVIPAEPTNVGSAQPTNVGSAKAADVSSAEATPHVASAEATADMATASAKSATTTVSAATASAAAGLRTGGDKAAGEQHCCQSHHHSSSHNNLLSSGRTIRHKNCQTLAWAEENQTPRRDRREMGMLRGHLYYTRVHKTGGKARPKSEVASVRSGAGHQLRVGS